MGKLGDMRRLKQMEKQEKKDQKKGADAPFVAFILPPGEPMKIQFSGNWNPLALIGFMDEIAVGMSQHKNSVRQAINQARAKQGKKASPAPAKEPAKAPEKT